MKKIFILFLSIFLSLSAFGNDSIIVKSGVNRIILNDSVAKDLENPVNNVEEVSLFQSKRQFNNLPGAPNISNQTFHINTVEYGEFNDPNFTDQFYNDKVDSLRSAAKAVIDDIQKYGKFVNIIMGKEKVELPVGLKVMDSINQKTKALIAVTSMRFNPQYTEIDVVAQLTIPQQEEPLFFGGKGIRISNDGGITDGKLTLLGDYAIPFNGGNWLITLKGGIDMSTGELGELTYIKMSCTGIEEIAFEADVRVSRKLVVPIELGANTEFVDLCQGEELKGFVNDDKKIDQKLLSSGDWDVKKKCYVGASFKVVSSGWNDLLAELSLPLFTFPKNQKLAFKVEDAVFDFSDHRNSALVSFPEEYTTNGLIPDNPDQWRGFYMRRFEMYLPQEFKKAEKQNKRLSVSGTDLIFDSYGISGKVAAHNVLPLGKAGSWGFSVDSLKVELLTNTLVGAEMGGEIFAPLFGEGLKYVGWFNNDGYGLTAALREKLPLPVLSGAVVLYENSSITMEVKNGDFLPSMNLTGHMTVGSSNTKLYKASTEAQRQWLEAQKTDTLQLAKDKSEMPVIQIAGIRFQELQLQTVKPFIKTKYFGYENSKVDSNKVANFPIEINRLELITPNDEDLNFLVDFDLKLAPDIVGTTAFIIKGKMDDSRGIQIWKYKSMTFEKIGIDVDRSGVKINGELSIIKNDPTYGNCIGGKLEARIEQINLLAGANAMFGNTKENMRYYFVDIWAEKNSHIDTKGFPIKSFLGGVSYHMKRTDVFAETHLSQAKYIPDETEGLGIKASVTLESQNKVSFNAMAYLSLNYNARGGLNRLYIIGDGSFMEKAAPVTTQTKEVLISFQIKFDSWLKKMVGGDKLQKIEDFVNKYGNLLATTKAIIPYSNVVESDKQATKGAFGAYVSIEKDYQNDVFHGIFEAYINTPVLWGRGDNGLVGHVEYYKSPDKWFVHIGEPTKPIGLIALIAGADIGASGYFMSGYDLPSMLTPSREVLDILGEDALLTKNRNENHLVNGKGFALGLDFSIGGHFNAGLIYAWLKAGAGLDIMNNYYGQDVHCKGRSGPVGNNGWYAQGQIYAYLEGEIGVKVKVWGLKTRIPILFAGTAALLKGQFPNPSNFEGHIGIYYSVLGGKISGRKRLKVNFGEECEMVGIEPSLEFKTISEIVPNDGESDVDVFAVPSAAFNFAIDQPFTIDTDEGSKSYIIKLEKFEAISQGKAIEGKLKWNNTNDLVYFESQEVLPPKQMITLTAEVSFLEKSGSGYVPVKQDGKELKEVLVSNFSTSTAPDHIPWTNIQLMYPIKDMTQYYPNEYEKGYIKLKRGQSYLITDGWKYNAAFYDENDKLATESALSYNSAERTFHFNTNGLKTDEKYFTRLYSESPGDKSTPTSNNQSKVTDFKNQVTKDNFDTDIVQVKNKKASLGVRDASVSKTLLEFGFQSSAYKTFEDKVNSIKITMGKTDPKNNYVRILYAETQSYDMFTQIELLGNGFTEELPLVRARSKLNSKYYKNEIYPLIYEGYPINDRLTFKRNTDILGVPPKYSMHIPAWYEIDVANGVNNSKLSRWMPYNYYLSDTYFIDYVDLQYKIINGATSGSYISQKRVYHFYHSHVPVMSKGVYEAEYIYTLPGNKKSSTATVKYSNDY